MSDHPKPKYTSECVAMIDRLVCARGHAGLSNEEWGHLNRRMRHADACVSAIDKLASEIDCRNDVTHTVEHYLAKLHELAGVIATITAAGLDASSPVETIKKLIEKNKVLLDVVVDTAIDRYVEEHKP